jgi:hypothetical protein
MLGQFAALGMHDGNRADEIEWHALVQMVVQTGERRAIAARIAAQLATRPGQGLLPSHRGGAGDTVPSHRHHRRDGRASASPPERHGLTYITVHDYYLEAFAPVIETFPPDTRRRTGRSPPLFYARHVDAVYSFAADRGLRVITGRGRHQSGRVALIWEV